MKRAACTNNDESRSRGEHGSEGTSAVQPGPFDVLLGRGKGTLLHVGNQRFQRT